MSTLDQADVDVMKATKTCVAAQRFQYGYLNDDINDFGQIDYTLTNKIPKSLQQAIADGKKILVLINPPYAEAGNRSNNSILDDIDNKAGVAKTKLSETAMDGYGKASNELFVQFLVRIRNEIPTASIAMFSTLKYVVSPNFEKFRDKWNAKYLGGFAVHNKAFEGLNGKFPIGFLIWATNQKAKNKIAIKEISVDVLDKKATPIGEKIFFNLPNSMFLNGWIKRPKANTTEVIALKNAVSPSTAKIKLPTWSEDAIAYMLCDSNDMQHAEQRTTIFSSVYKVGNDGGFYVTSENLLEAAIIFSARRLIAPTWLNDRDQFLQPDKPLTEAFKSDCLIWMLFNRCNRTASANDLQWNGKQWSIVNHFIPFTEEEVGSPDRFESDFMVQYLAKTSEVFKTSEVLPSKTSGGFSQEANQVLAEGKKLWQAYFAHTDVHTVRDELKLNRADVGWYQIRKALQARNASGDFAPVNFKPFEEAYKALTSKLQPLVYELGFLKL
ncbi:MAG: hypothetical protein H7178_12605 [Chitinophagaceae bacterium]|nr:hypothetical protein [Chitinophagaceae bacterium]